MKKRILSLIMALCALCTVAFALTGCDLLGSLFGEEEPPQKSDYELMFENLDNFTLKGSGAEIIEYYYVEDGLRLYTPYNQDVTRREAYWHADEENDVYTYYVKNSAGGWTVDKTKTKTEYTNARVNTVDLMFGCLKTEESKFTLNGDKYTNSEDIQKPFAVYTAVFKDVEITIGDNHEMLSATYKLILSDGTNSFTYNFILIAGQTTLTYPSTF